MIENLIYVLTLISAFIFMQMNHPLAMGLMLLIQTLLICMISGVMMKSMWFSYILFLTFLGGMLVLFIYVTSLASNEMFSLSMTLMISTIAMFSIISLLIWMMDKSYIISIFANQEITNFYPVSNFLEENSLNLSKLYNYPTNFLTILLINYLLLTLVAVVKITNVFYGPLRSSS